jgi:hypothetical protein
MRDRFIPGAPSGSFKKTGRVSTERPPWFPNITVRAPVREALKLESE